MGQRSSAVQDRDGFALFVVLQPLMDLKGQIVFISKASDRKEISVGLQRPQRELPEQTHARVWRYVCTQKPMCTACMKTCTASVHTTPHTRAHSQQMKTTSDHTL